MIKGRGNEWKLDHTVEPSGGWTMIRGPVVINVQDAALLHDLVKRASAVIPMEELNWALELIRNGSECTNHTTKKN
jgi:hypothetical protein